MKKCNTCEVTKAEEDYYARRNKCKDCVQAEQRRYRSENREAMLQTQHEWRVKNSGHTYLDKRTGYTMYIDVNHPSTGPSGMTRLHRVVLYDTLVANGADLNAIECHWCKTVHPWSDIKADHLSWDRADNRPENLVPSCWRCNLKRKKPVALKRCKVDDCTRKTKAADLCNTHYKQVWLGHEVGDIQYRPDKATREAIVFDIQAGMTVKGVGKKYNIDMSSVSRIYKRETGHTVADWRKAQKSKER